MAAGAAARVRARLTAAAWPMVGKRRLRAPADWAPPEPDDPGPACPLCGRPVPPGAAGDVHHWVPRSQGGRTTADNTARLHRICHRKLHAVLSERELARIGARPEALRAHPQIATFVAWVQRRPLDFDDTTRRPRRP
jgi:5-methylcytosine-specific restriction endonuclease McrA